ncbi:MAG: hypothetical protein JOZ58_05715 [Acetobacteraceae bacterium]|nr:hypothetical protein [Acetobacteraceae bacterium]
MLSKHHGKLCLAVVLAFGLTAVSAHAFAENAQQTKMTSCNADASSKNLKGDERKAYMKTCLSSSPAAPAKTNSQQEKMKTCNAQAKEKSLKGDERKQFMSTCLRGS